MLVDKILRQYIDLARAKSEAVDNIYSLFKQNIKSFNAKRRTVKKKNNKRANQQKNNFARAAHFFCTFLCRCFARLQRKPSRNLFLKKTSYAFSFTFFSLPLIFSLHWWLLAFLILSPPLQNFHVVLPTKNDSFLFYLLLQFSVPPFLVQFRWPAASLLFLCLSLALYSKFEDMTINLS